MQYLGWVDPNPQSISNALIPSASAIDTSARRADIQGIRALAVLLVVLFHTGFILEGGFIGVDVFFVVSGYVITGMLWREAERRGTISLGNFYKRRFRRLMPALSLTLTFTMLIGIFIFSPVGTQETTAQTAIGALLLSANFVIEKISGGYFGVSALSNPLLNTWSLSVEEQFYLVFPLGLLLALFLGRRIHRGRKLSSKFAVTIIVLATVLSFLLSVRRTGESPLSPSEVLSWLDGGFYSPLSRVWEFGVGALLAFFTLNYAQRFQRSRKIASASGLAGACLLIMGLLLINTTTPFPSFWTLLPVTGTALLLLAGIHQGNSLSRLLSVRPLTLVGDWSYSIYLWNWPLVAISATLWPNSILAILTATLVGIPLAAFSYQFWETPLRRNLQIGILSSKAVAVSLVTVPLLLGIFFVYQSDKLVQDSGFMKSLSWVPYFEENWNRCSLSYSGTLSRVSGVADFCVSTGQAGEAVDVVLVGDSHAAALYPGLASQLGKRVVALGSTPENATESPDSEKIPVTVLAFHWESISKDEGAGVIKRLESELQQLESMSNHILVVEDVPLFSHEATECVFPALLGPEKCIEEISKDRFDYTNDFLEVVARHPNTHFVSVRDLFCETDECRFDPKGEVLFRDSNHLNPRGSSYIAERIAPLVEDLIPRSH